MLEHAGDKVREFFRNLPRPARVGIEATGSMQWFLELMQELGVECQMGHPAKIRAAEPAQAEARGGSAIAHCGNRDMANKTRAAGKNNGKQRSKN